MARNTRAKKVQEAPQVDIGAEIFGIVLSGVKSKGYQGKYSKYNRKYVSGSNS